MIYPIKIASYVTAMYEAQEASVKEPVPIYLFRASEGYYVIDTQAGEYSNEKLIIKLYRGQRQ
jgi:hypothetical protein